jgi:hypothetical protein
VTSLQSLQSEIAVPRWTCSHGVFVIMGPGGEELLSWFFSSPARCRCGSLVVPRALLGLASRLADPRGYRLHAVFVVRSSRDEEVSSRSANGLRSPTELRYLAPVGKPTFLSWDSSGPAPVSCISARFVCRPTLSPLHRQALRRPLPVRCHHRTFGLGHTMPEVPFRPRGFAPPRRFSPPRALLERC